MMGQLQQKKEIHWVVPLQQLLVCWMMGQLQQKKETHWAVPLQQLLVR
jgi:hypothetical protein